MRTYANHITKSVQELLDQLVARPEPVEYRRLMTRLGEELAPLIAEKLVGYQRIMLICTNEDADYLATGVLQALSAAEPFQIFLACFWNDRLRLDSGLDVAPIIRQYIEPAPSIDAFVVVKSIIATACVVQTNISEIFHQYQPQKVVVAAPVMMQDSIPNLESEFEESISKRFQYVWFAQDDELTANGEAVPGIGGSVYELLGIGTSSTKNSYVPAIVQQRRAAHAPS